MQVQKYFQLGLRNQRRTQIKLHLPTHQCKDVESPELSCCPFVCPSALNGFILTLQLFYRLISHATLAQNPLPVYLNFLNFNRAFLFFFLNSFLSVYFNI